MRQSLHILLLLLLAGCLNQNSRSGPELPSNNGESFLGGDYLEVMLRKMPIILEESLVDVATRSPEDATLCTCEGPGAVCGLLQALDHEQRAVCGRSLVANAQALLTAVRNPRIMIQPVADTPVVDGQVKSAKTNRGPDGVIYLHVLVATTIPAKGLGMLLAHEYGHHSLIDGQYPDDESSSGILGRNQDVLSLFGAYLMENADAKGILDRHLTEREQNEPPGEPPRSPLSRWVQAIYSDLLGRTATSGDIAVWLDVYHRRNQSPLAVAGSIFDTREARRNWLRTIYLESLQRTPTPGDVDYWVGALLHRGRTEEQVLAAIYGSDEYFAKNGGTNELFVKGMYALLLGRTPTDVEIAPHLQLLATAQMTRAGLALFYLTTNEYRERAITRAFNRYFQRPPSADERQFHLARAVATGTAATVRRELVGGLQYLARFTQP